LNFSPIVTILSSKTDKNVRDEEKKKKPGLDEILQEIGRSSLLTHEEELALLKAVQKKGTDCDEMKQLEKANMRFIVSVANQYQKQGLTLEELIEAGTEGLRKGAMKYNFEADFKFIAYAVWWIRQSIIQTIEEKKQK
jgi:RNA polymerase primary sigma factor